MKLNNKDWEKYSNNLETISISISFFTKLARQIWDGNSLERSFLNISLEGTKISGNIIDLGSGTSKPSYLKYFDIKNIKSITLTDFYRGGTDVLKLNLEKPFPKQRKKYDYVICMNTLEHVFNFANVIQQSKNLLKEEGYFIGSTPFLYNLHPSPNDYYRFSHQALIKAFSDIGFKTKKMVYLGFGPFTASYSQWFFMLPRLLRIPISFICILTDVFVMKYSKYYRYKHPLGYLFIFQLNKGGTK